MSSVNRVLSPKWQCLLAACFVTIGILAIAVAPPPFVQEVYASAPECGDEYPCPDGQFCCDGNCCDVGQYCCDGVCSDCPCE